MVLCYVLPDGSFAQGGRTFAWCEACAGPTDAECKLDAAAIEAEIAVWEARRPWRLRIFASLFRGAPLERAYRDNLQAILQLARIRVSPPRCLCCGATAVTVLPGAADANHLLHSCGYPMHLEPADRDAPSFSFRKETIWLNAEGQRIESR